MSASVQELLNQIMALPMHERANLAQEIMATLQPESLGPALIQTIERMCANEAESRLDAYERGEIRGLSEEEAMRWFDEQGAA